MLSADRPYLGADQSMIVSLLLVSLHLVATQIIRIVSIKISYNTYCNAAAASFGLRGCRLGSDMVVGTYVGKEVGV